MPQTIKEMDSSIEWMTMPVEIPVKRYSDSVVIIPKISKEKLREAIEQEMRGDSVEIFIKGEKYSSLKDYQKNMGELKNVDIPEKKISSPEIYAQFKTLSDEQLDQLNKEELKRMIRVMAQDKNIVKEGVAQAEAEELQKMADDYAKTQKDLAPIVIDPKKVKTITIGGSQEKVILNSTNPSSF
ncbi:MAG TPA: hypothetical protein PLH56_06115 [Candidatus Omnitrophota bacterium]|nr:hypothetical protein [Candidatus Omnitrophota bacterium]HPN88892.1 hypothetical protein [Candidatus Omnitrophota bacterium]